MRTSNLLFGHRYLMDTVIPGGVARDIDTGGIAGIRREIDAVGVTVSTLREIYVNQAGLQDRFVDCGRIRQDQAERLGLTGLAGRASGIGSDLRVRIPPAPYDRLGVNMVVRTGGDVAARATVRVDDRGIAAADRRDPDGPPGGDIAIPFRMHPRTHSASAGSRAGAARC